MNYTSVKLAKSKRMIERCFCGESLSLYRATTCSGELWSLLECPSCGEVKSCHRRHEDNMIKDHNAQKTLEKYFQRR